MPDPAPTTEAPPSSEAPKTEAPASPLGAAQAETPKEEPKTEEKPAPETAADKLYPKDGEEKPEEKAAEEEEAPKEEPKPALTPEQITAAAAEYKFELPEGFKPDEAKMTTFRELAAKRGLDQTEAQELLNLGLDQAKTTGEAVLANIENQWNTTLETWKTELQADPDIGGAKTEGALRVIGRALDEYGSPEARQAFDLTGAGWNPAIVRFVHKMAAALSEGQPVIPKGPTGQRAKTPGGRLYSSPAQQ